MAKGYLGPAAQTFLSGELHALGINANTVTPSDVSALVDRVREHAARVMGPQKAAELADALAHCQGVAPSRGHGGHRLADDAAAKLLASGKLRQAEKAYLELVQKHGDLSAYVGLARTQASLEDTDAALTTLREGAAKYARANDRASAVSLLAEAVALVPADLAAHRRLAAALANQGDLPGAVEEYARFVEVAVARNDPRRALLEIEYGRETLGDLPGLIALVDRVTGVAAQTRLDGPRPAARPASFPHQQTVPAPPPAAPLVTPARRPVQEPAIRPAASEPAVRPATSEPALRPAASEAASRVAAPAPIAKPPTPAAKPSSMPLTTRTRGTAAHAEPVVAAAAPTVTETRPVDADADGAVDVLSRAGVVRRKLDRPPVDIDQQLAAIMTTGSGIEAATGAASRAALLTGAHDPRATDAVLDAARRLLALGKLQSASDVLLDFIGHGFTDREAQRLLIEVDCALGRRDVAKEKCTLLSQAYRLDGKADVADDVDRLAQML